MDASVALAAAYLQLNGYFVLTELPVQVEERHGFRTATDIDVLAVRLPHAAELIPGHGAHARDLLLGQDPTLETDPERTEILIAEVKRGRAHINAGSFNADVLRFALRRTGCCPAEMIDAHAYALARAGMIETRTADGHPCRVRLASFAGEPVPLRPAGVLSVGLDQCVAFIRERLDRYREPLRGAYFRDPVLNLLGLVDAVARRPAQIGREIVHAP
ncbi:MAG: hypothetical protein HYX56_04045 [Chloroflexi bacterium]|nr:hypothetical protein [Chloroflexota bacterium]